MDEYVQAEGLQSLEYDDVVVEGDGNTESESLHESEC